MFESMTTLSRRANRLEYLFGVLLIWIAYSIALMLMQAGPVVAIIGFLALIALSVLQMILTKNRFNDFGYSGWWILVPFAPVIAFFVPGDLTDNKFGPKV
jgi:uncharacterized membrane protein YhaH (DUF805 family)